MSANKIIPVHDEVVQLPNPFVVGSGPPLLMYAPGGFDATLEKWSTQGVYAKIKPVDHLSRKYTCITFDRRECADCYWR